jgi:hypothetical protein
MNDAGLSQLEREVEAARARLASDLSTLRSPAAFNEFAEGLKHETLEAKDALIEKAKSSAQSTVQSFVEDLKAKAAANPAAALAIGAGIAWRFIQHPPIATALIGAGLFSLLRTTPVQTNGYDDADYLAHAKERLKEQASDAAGVVKEQAVEMAGTVREQAIGLAGAVKEQAAELAGTAKAKVGQWSADAQAAVQHTASDFKDQATSLSYQASAEFDEQVGSVRRSAADAAAGAARIAHRTSSAVQSTLSDQDVRDKLLLGVAGAAVVAALGLAYQRRLEDERD